MGLSKTRRANRYSLILLRAAFIHRDYMHMYMTYLPTTSIFQTVATNFNCEDLAMSLFVTYLRNGTKPHYLADLWAISSMVKLYSPAGGISLTGGHKTIRHQCVTNFTKELGLFSGSTHRLLMRVPYTINTWYASVAIWSALTNWCCWTKWRSIPKRLITDYDACR